MKLAFTTLACPNWTLRQVVENAVQMGYDAVDFRGLLEDIDVSTRPEFTTGLHETKQLFADHGLVISGLSIGARYAVVDPTEKQQQFDETRRNLALAAKLDAHLLRVYGGRVPDGHTVDTIMPYLVENLRQMGDEAAEYGVTLTLETHDAWTDSAVFGRLLAQVDHPRVRALWDLHHPFRANGEPPETTYANIGHFTANTHIKDSLATADGGHRYVLLGEGDVPLKRMLDMLVQGGYDGYATFEWEKRWHPNILEPEVAIPHFAQTMRQWVG